MSNYSTSITNKSLLTKSLFTCNSKHELVISLLSPLKIYTPVFLLYISTSCVSSNTLNKSETNIFNTYILSNSIPCYNYIIHHTRKMSTKILKKLQYIFMIFNLHHCTTLAPQRTNALQYQRVTSAPLYHCITVPR